MADMNQMNDFEEEIERDAKRLPPEGKLEYVRDQVRNMRDLDLRISAYDEELKRMRSQRRELEMQVLPDLFMQLGLTHLGLEADGNMPAYEAKLKDYYFANIKADWPDDRREAAFDWLAHEGLDDLVRTTLTVEIGKGNAKLVAEILQALAGYKVAVSKKQSVPWTSLTAMLKERYKSGKPLDDGDLYTLGAFVGKQIELKTRKGD